jgi:hypothetical protein
MKIGTMKDMKKSVLSLSSRDGNSGGMSVARPSRAGRPRATLIHRDSLRWSFMTFMIFMVFGAVRASGGIF